MYTNKELIFCSIGDSWWCVIGGEEAENKEARIGWATAECCSSCLTVELLINLLRIVRVASFSNQLKIIYPTINKSHQLGFPLWPLIGREMSRMTPRHHLEGYSQIGKEVVKREEGIGSLMHLKQRNGYFKFRYGDLIFIKWGFDGLLLFTRR